MPKRFVLDASLFKKYSTTEPTLIDDELTNFLNVLNAVIAGIAVICVNAAINEEYCYYVDKIPEPILNYISEIVANDYCFDKKGVGKLISNELEKIDETTLRDKRDYLNIAAGLENRIIVSTEVDKVHIYNIPSNAKILFIHGVKCKCTWEYYNENIRHSLEALSSKVNDRIDKQNVGEPYMRDKIEIHGGRIGAVGSNHHVHDISFNEVWNEKIKGINLDELAKELEILRLELKKEAKEPEHDISIGNIAAAENFARNGDGPKTVEYLQKAGKWTLKAAEKIGAPLATEALKKLLGL